MSAKTTQQGMKSKRRANLLFYISMVALPLLQFVIFWLVVKGNSIVLSFKHYTDNIHYTLDFSNYIRVFHDLTKDAAIIDALKNSFDFYFLTSIITIPVSLLISFYIYKKFIGYSVFKVVLFFPSLISSVVTVTAFLYLADWGYPAFMETLFGEKVRGLISNASTRRTTILVYNIFFGLAGNFLYYSGAMSTIDDSIVEAAKLDGAGYVVEFFKITLPMIFPTFSTLFITSIANILINDYGLYVMFGTMGYKNVQTMGFYLYDKVRASVSSNVELAYCAAFGMVLTVVAMVITFTVRKVVNRFDPFREEVVERR